MTHYGLQKAREQKALKRFRKLESIRKMQQTKRSRLNGDSEVSSTYYSEPYVVVATSKSTDTHLVSPQHDIDTCLFQASPPPAPREASCPVDLLSKEEETTDVSPRVFQEIDCSSTTPCVDASSSSSISVVDTISMNVSSTTAANTTTTYHPLSLRIPETIDVYHDDSYSIGLHGLLGKGILTATNMFISPLSDDGDGDYQGNDRTRYSALMVPVSLPSFEELTIVSAAMGALQKEEQDEERVVEENMSVD